MSKSAEDSLHPLTLDFWVLPLINTLPQVTDGRILMSNGIEDACQISELQPCDEQPSQASLN